MRLAVLLLFALLALPPPGAWAQPDASAQRTVRAWIDGQQRLAQRIEHVAFVERSRRGLHGPFGSQVMEVDARVSGAPGGEWARELRRVRMDDRDVPPDEWGGLDERHHMLRGPLARMIEDIGLPLRLARQLRPRSVEWTDDADGDRVLRVDLEASSSRRAPRDRRGDPRRDRRRGGGRGPEPPAVESATFWFDAGAGRLTRSIVRLRGSDDAPVTITTSYARVDGMDVPRHRRVDGTHTVRRRMRTFTLSFDLDASYSDYRIRLR